ncbi:MAG: methyltransferase domain-containing protein [Nitrospira sp. LK70]|nr:methyltransferase domain-containing protein [Nitrospira sp. LK70]
MFEEVLHRHRAVWQKKPELRRLYEDWYGEIIAWLVPGRTVELGGGTGNLKATVPGVYCSDVVVLPWLNVVADAQRLPFLSESLANLVLFDSLHHIENVSLFFDEALRTLHVGGRIIIMDPYLSWVSWPIYRWLHPEPMNRTEDPLVLKPPRSDRRPFDANQAVATILFERNQPRFQSRYPGFSVQHIRRLACLAYPLSGGFDHPSFLPEWLMTPILRLERTLERIGRLLAFRMLVVIERRS